LQRFWLDADVLIQANRFYPSDIFPDFWTLLINQNPLQTIKSPHEVLGELTGYGDELTDWAKDQRNASFFIEPDGSVQATFTKIADHVNDYYLMPQAKEFLDGADPWVIAHAKCDLGTVVTWERKGGAGSKKVKIPNICDVFEVEWINPRQMFRELGVSFKMEVKGK
jgi:Domain of unknown function (DUF4411)